MNFLWIFDLPSWELLVALTSFFTALSVVGFLITERSVKKWLGHTLAENDIVSNFLSLAGAIYGITLGLVAVITWGNYSKTEELLFKEATLLGTLYMNVSHLPPPYDKQLKDELKEVTRYIIYEGWPQQEKGIIPRGGNTEKFQQILYSIKPTTENEKILIPFIVAKYNEMFEVRKEREKSINNGLPREIYWVLFIGAVICIATTWLLVTKKRLLHIVTTALTGILLGSLIFLVIAMDYPFLGAISISNDPYMTVYTSIMSK